MAIPHFRKAKLIGRLRCWGSQNLSKRNRPYRESSTRGSYGADVCDFKRMEAARVSAFGTKRVHRPLHLLPAWIPSRGSSTLWSKSGHAMLAR
jgi:hypothetical protein